MFSVESKWCPFTVDFTFWNKNKSQGARSGDEGGCGITVMDLDVKNWAQLRIPLLLSEIPGHRLGSNFSHSKFFSQYKTNGFHCMWGLRKDQGVRVGGLQYCQYSQEKISLITLLSDHVFQNLKTYECHLIFIQTEKMGEVFCLMVNGAVNYQGYIHIYHSITNTNILTTWKMGGVHLKLWYLICWGWYNSNVIPSAKASDWTFFPLFLHYAPRVENPVRWGCSALSPLPATKIWTLGRPMRLN